MPQGDISEDDSAACAACRQAAGGSSMVQISNGLHWKQMNSPVFQQVLFEGTDVRHVELQQGDQLCMACVSGRPQAAVRRAAAAAASHPSSWEGGAEFPTKLTYVKVGEAAVGMDVVVKFSRQVLGFTPSVERRLGPGVEVRREASVPVTSSKEWTLQQGGRAVHQQSVFLHDTYHLVPECASGAGAR